MTHSSLPRRLVLLAVLALVLGALAWWLWLKPADGDSGKRPQSRAGSITQPTGGRPWRGAGSFSPPAIPVRVVAAKQGDFALYYKALGTVTAQTTVNVRARVSGQLQELRFEEGQQVAKGDVLAVIDPRPYQVTLEQAKSAVQESRAQLKNAQIDLQRYQKLHEEDSIARQTLDTQQAQVNQNEAALARQQALLAEAQLNLDFTEVRAPASGRLGLRQVDVGNLVGPSDATPLVVITQTRPISLSFTLPERDLPPVLSAFRRGEKLKVEAWDREERQKLASGVLHSLDNQIDTNTGTLRFKAQFANEDESLFPNQFVNVRLLVTTLKEAVLLPSAAVQYGTNGTFAFVVEDEDGQSKVHLRMLQVGVEDSGQVVIQSGLKAGDRVVLEGVDRLREGGRVEVVKDESSEDAVQAAQALEGRNAPQVRAEPDA